MFYFSKINAVNLFTFVFTVAPKPSVGKKVRLKPKLMAPPTIFRKDGLAKWMPRVWERIGNVDPYTKLKKEEVEKKRPPPVVEHIVEIQVQPLHICAKL